MLTIYSWSERVEIEPGRYAIVWRDAAFISPIVPGKTGGRRKSKCISQFLSVGKPAPYRRGPKFDGSLPLPPFCGLWKLMSGGDSELPHAHGKPCLARCTYPGCFRTQRFSKRYWHAGTSVACIGHRKEAARLGFKAPLPADDPRRQNQPVHPTSEQ